MRNLHAILILVAAYFAVFFESWFDGFRYLFGTQIDFLPGLMIYAGLNNSIPSIALTALWGGLWFDSLSANPLGVSVLPLLCIGLVVHQGRELLAREHPIAQLALGAAASAFQPLAVLFILLNIGASPIIGWKTIWQWLVMTIGGGLMTPVWFAVFSRIHHAFDYQPASESSFRPDRQIKRGRY